MKDGEEGGEEGCLGRGMSGTDPPPEIAIQVFPVTITMKSGVDETGE